jgi:transcription initiation factor TFIID TATA-box-binding protein
LFDRLEVLGVDTPEPHVSFDNVVCTSDLGGPVDLTTAAIGLGLEHIEYEPEQFSALQFSPDVDGSSAMFLIFNSGSVTITGVESHEQAKEELDILISELKKVNLYPIE